MKAMERRALQSEAMGLWLGEACELTLRSERHKQNASGQPSTKNGIVTFVSVPPPSVSPLDRHSYCRAACTCAWRLMLRQLWNRLLTGLI